MNRLALVTFLILLSVVIVEGVMLLVTYYKKGITMFKPKLPSVVSQYIVAKSAGQYKFQDFAGVEIDARDSSQALVAGTLISIDNQTMTALLELQIPDYVRSAAIKKYGVIKPKEQPERITVFLKPASKFIDPFNGRKRTYEEMVSSQDGNLAKMIGLFIQIVATGRLDGKLEARQVAVAGITTVKE
ncbi:TPA: hypothetical protein DD690_02645 [Candidatus Daviesbacteria bacterium]|nr:hypothetical protein [Candidatus Daviesbacteria bacterium]